jgi:hypothetical protein
MKLGALETSIRLRCGDMGGSIRQPTLRFYINEVQNNFASRTKCVDRVEPEPLADLQSDVRGVLDWPKGMLDIYAVHVGDMPLEPMDHTEEARWLRNSGGEPESGKPDFYILESNQAIRLRRKPSTDYDTYTVTLWGAGLPDQIAADSGAEVALDIPEEYSEYIIAGVLFLIYSSKEWWDPEKISIFGAIYRDGVIQATQDTTRRRQFTGRKKVRPIGVQP